ncbi:MAG: hypothetical protein ABFS38_09670 [Bacteroidota bacterium]
MKKLSLLLSGLLLLLICTGCTSVKRFKSATYKTEDNTLVDMELFGSRLTMEETVSPERNMWDLSASAQTQLIQILNERYPDNEQFIGALSNEYLTLGETASLDLTGKKLRMVFTISKRRDYSALNDASGRFSQADRIEYLRFTLEIPEKYNLRFKEWNRYVTEYGEIEIADVSFSRSFDLDVDGSLSPQTDVGGKGSLSRSESQEVRSRYLKLNGSISDRKIGVEEEGTREIDLTGNVIADVSLEFEGFPERLTIPLFSREGNEGSGAATVASLKFVDVLVPRMQDAPETINATLQLDYIYRHVQTGWKTYQEWDDQVEYYSGTVKKEIILFTKEDYIPHFYGIGTELGGKTLIKVRTGTGVDYPLQFKDYPDSSRFLEWLQSLPEEGDGSKTGEGRDPGSGMPVMIGKNSLLINGEPITTNQLVKSDLKVLPVY